MQALTFLQLLPFCTLVKVATTCISPCLDEKDLLQGFLVPISPADLDPSSLYRRHESKLSRNPFSKGARLPQNR
jgi:hypothetical protein